MFAPRSKLRVALRELRKIIKEPETPRTKPRPFKAQQRTPHTKPRTFITKRRELRKICKDPQPLQKIYEASKAAAVRAGGAFDAPVEVPRPGAEVTTP